MNLYLLDAYLDYDGEVADMPANFDKSGAASD